MLIVYASGSLRPALDDLGARPVYANARDLAERIEAGERADVFCSASPAHPHRLHAAGLLAAPRPFATNRLVIAVPANSPDVDLETARLVIEVEGVPLGDYTRALFKRLDIAPRNIVFEETIVDAVADRILAGEAEAGVLYATDVAARPGLRAIEPRVTIEATYVAGVLTRAQDPVAAEAWIEALTSASALRAAGFGPP